ncbi:hypothetical protein [Corynebacterium pseudotuberculosis]|uniref:hypothetical protein n=1 Tax=Corynebacterium pseudotuberculosis TaxID=1719 RepID=UPI001CB774C9|nr:hypothetical protein [Corynebacterium pseudotuberculosis]MEB3093923.1 hypothetical protein [Corynebacterium pseudotuberculosis]MEB3107687.1 hypothetical protein [Corynebacterium pseudotuberculosis]
MPRIMTITVSEPVLASSFFGFFSFSRSSVPTGSGSRLVIRPSLIFTSRGFCDDAGYLRGAF